MELPPDIPPEAAAYLQSIGYLDEDRLHVGDASPRITLTDMHAGAPVVIGAPDAPWPTVLIFGSYT